MIYQHRTGSFPHCVDHLIAHSWLFLDCVDYLSLSDYVKKGANDTLHEIRPLRNLKVWKDCH